jgi:hypothetical protein
MNASIIVDDIIKSLERRYGKSHQRGRARVLTFGLLRCSINYSKLLNGHKYFFAVPQEILDAGLQADPNAAGEFVVLICGSAERVLFLPKALVMRTMKDVPTRRLDILLEDGAFILQATKYPKIDVIAYLNAFPKLTKAPEPTPEGPEANLKDRIHVKIQWGLISLGRAEDCSVWVPVSDRNLSYQGNQFSSATISRLPNFGFDENTRRIVQNIDVLWLRQNVIRKAFEIESTTSIYSGLLRMNDLVLAQPNVNIELYLATATARREKVRCQLSRPSFRSLVEKVQSVSFEDIEAKMTTLDSLPIKHGARVSGLLRGERFEPIENFAYPTNE